MPLYFGGASEVALQVGSKHADVYALWGEPLKAVKERMAEVQTAAAPFGRSPRFSVSTRPILGRTEAEAWERARTILEKVEAGPQTVNRRLKTASLPVGSQRLLKYAQESEVHDKCLWMPIAAATGASGNSSALVGTPEQVAEAMLGYYDIGVTTLLIRGFDPLGDAGLYGEELIPLVREGVAQREQQPAPA